MSIPQRHRSPSPAFAPAGSGVGILFIDTETGGTEAQTDALLEVGFALWKGGGIVGRKRWIVQVEGRTIHPKAMAINKIDLVAHKEVARPRAEVAHEIVLWLDTIRTDRRFKLRVGGHNTAFDIRFLRALVGEENWRGHVRTNCVDTASILTFMRHAGRLPSGADLNLHNGLKAVGIEIEKGVEHTALGDATNTARLYGKLLEMIQV